jgi:AcrR family transcriptional regulator
MATRKRSSSDKNTARPTRTLAAAPSRRDEHKMRTRRAIQQAALELFAEKGYDDTTTEEIAERAGVSPRTFFRYFATKESALFVGGFGWFQSLTDVYLAQPPALIPFDALRNSLVVLAPGLVPRRRSLLLYKRAVASSPTLRGRLLDHQAEDVANLADALAARQGLAEPDERCMVLAAVGLVTHRRAIDRWLGGPASADPGDVIADEFEVLNDVILGEQRPRRAAAR